MRHHVAVTVRCPEPDPVRTYEMVTSFDEFPAHTDVVRSVVQESDRDPAISHWDVNFRRGRLCWTEEDRFDLDGLTATFEAIAGDPLEFRGRWVVSSDGQGSIVTFEATLELGVGSFEGVLDPIAAQTVAENVAAILGSILRGAEVQSQQIKEIPSAIGTAKS